MSLVQYILEINLFTMRSLIALLCYSSPVAATLHHLFVGAFRSPNLYAVGFDDQSLALTLLNNITTQDSHFWITLDVSWHRCSSSNWLSRLSVETNKINTIYSIKKRICILPL